LDPTTWIVDAASAESRNLMLVGHFPQMPQLLAHFTTGRADAQPLPFPMNGMVTLEDVEGVWIERWRLGGNSTRG
jgi:phosphohistidine phosphatase SixA